MENKDVVETEKSQKSKFKIKKSYIIGLIIFSLLTSFLLFSLFWEVPIPYDENHMYIEEVTCVDLNKDDAPDWCILEDAIEKGYVSKDYQGDTFTRLMNCYKDLNYVSFGDVERTVERNGRNVKVIYFSYTRPLFAILFNLLGDGYSGSSIRMHSEFDNDLEDEKPFEPIFTEVYCLRHRDLYKLEDIDIKEYDALREKAQFVWSGNVDYRY